MYDTDGDERRFFVVIIPVNEVFLLEDGNQDKSKIDQDKLKIDQDKPKIDQDKPKSNQDKTEIDQDKLKIDQDKILENLEKNLLRNNKKEYKKQMLKRMIDTLIYCDIAKTRVEILEHIGLTNHTRNFKEYIEPMVEMGFLKRTLPEIPTSKNQKYIITIEGNKLITNE